MKRVLTLVALVAFPALAQAQMQPGHWRIQVTLTSIDPPEGASSFKSPTIHEACVTPAQAAAGPMEIFRSRQARSPEQCQITRQSTDGDKLDAVMVCEQADSKVTTTMTGTVSATRVDFSTVIEIVGPRPIKMTSATAATWIGADCK